jgi:hypothetical protein
MEQGPRPTKIEKFDIENSPIRKAYELLGAHTPTELSNLYSEQDQKLMHSKAWDYRDPDLITNKIKSTLESVDPGTLTGEEQEWRNEILWFWNHHAISAAIWRYKDRDAAQRFATDAISYQSADHPNKITRLLQLLVAGDVKEARLWAEGIEDMVEINTATSLINDYEEDGFYFDKSYGVETLKKGILTSEQFKDSPFATRQKPGKTYSYKITSGNKVVEYFGAHHTTDPTDQQYVEIAEKFKTVNPEIVYVEGMENINNQKDAWRERISKISLEEAMAKGENVYTLKLAVDAGTDFESPEPNRADEIKHLSDEGFSKSDIFKFYIYRSAYQYQLTTKERSSDEAKAYLSRYIEEFRKNSRWSHEEINLLENSLWLELDVTNDSLYAQQVDPIPWDGKPQTIINDVSRASSYFRDQYIFERIAEGLKTHERAFVVYGSAHAVRQELALRMLLQEMR